MFPSRVGSWVLGGNYRDRTYVPTLVNILGLANQTITTLASFLCMVDHSRVRTDDLMLAKHLLSQLSYGPLNNSVVLTAVIAGVELRRSVTDKFYASSKTWWAL